MQWRSPAGKSSKNLVKKLFEIQLKLSQLTWLNKLQWLIFAGFRLIHPFKIKCLEWILTENQSNSLKIHQKSKFLNWIFASSKIFIKLKSSQNPAKQSDPVRSSQTSPSPLLRFDWIELASSQNQVRSSKNQSLWLIKSSQLT